MTVFVLTECMNQGEYTEPEYYAPAADSCEIIGVYALEADAASEKARLEEEAKRDADEFDFDEPYYIIEMHEVQ